MISADAFKFHRCAADTEMEAEVEPSIETQARLVAAEQEERFRQVPPVASLWQTYQMPHTKNTMQPSKMLLSGCVPVQIRCDVLE